MRGATDDEPVYVCRAKYQPGTGEFLPLTGNSCLAEVARIGTFHRRVEQAPTHRVSFAALLSGWWCQGIAISFVPTHYIGTLNGFIATWASVFLTAYFLR